MEKHFRQISLVFRNFWLRSESDVFGTFQLRPNWDCSVTFRDGSGWNELITFLLVHPEVNIKWTYLVRPI